MYACVFAAGGQKLFELAEEFSPLIEMTSPDTVVLSIDGLERRIGGPREIAGAIARRAADLGIQASIAIASNPDAAVRTARRGTGVNVLPEGCEADALGDLDVSHLPMSAELHDTLARWGIRTFAEFAALPPLGIVERFGVEGLHLQDIARGATARPLKLAPPPVSYEEHEELEYPLELLEPLLFVLSRMMNDICARLLSHARATTELRLRLALDDGTEHVRTIRLPVPVHEPKPLLKLLHLDLDTHPPKAPIRKVTLSVVPVDPRVVQNGLFRPPAPEPARLEVTLARICKLVGLENVGTPELLNTHRPDAFRLSKFAPSNLPADLPAGCTRLAMRMFRPPLAAKVTVEQKQIRRVAAQGVCGNVMVCSGPWRASGDWWTQNSWRRDEWDIALTDGALYRIFRSTADWFVDGMYD
jgi:protein ImuB